GIGQGGGGGGNHSHIGGDEGVALLFQGIADSAEVVRIGGDLGSILAGVEVLGTGIQRVHHGLIGVFVLQVEDDDALLVEEEAHAAHVAQVAAELVEVVAHVGSGTVAVVGQGLDHDCDAAGAVAFVGDGFVLGAVAALSALDGTLDVVVRD